MVTSTRHLLKILIICSVAAFRPSSAGASSHNPVTAEDVDQPAQKAKTITDTFMQQSFQLRMKYEYHNGFATDTDRENLQKIARKTSDGLESVAKQQRNLKTKIENYDSPDWDARYGLTGLWRKSAFDLYATILSKSEVDFYLALTQKQTQQDKTLHEISAQIDSLELAKLPPRYHLLKAKTFALLSQTDPAYERAATEQFESLMNRSDINPATTLWALIEKDKILKTTEIGELNEPAGKIEKDDIAANPELVLSLALLQRQYSRRDFEKTVQTHPQVETTLGTLILSDITGKAQQQQGLSQFTIFETELAVKAAWRDNPQNHKQLLHHLANVERFQSSLILYVTATAFSQSSPERTVELLTDASTLQRIKPSRHLNIDALSIAQQAAQLAYNLFVHDSNNCELAIEAFENYCDIAGSKIEPELEYFYTTVMNDCGQQQKGEKLLEVIAGRPFGYWRNKAKLQLIIKTLRQQTTASQATLTQLKQLIDEFHQNNKQEDDTYKQAVATYCRLLLEQKDKTSAGKVLELLEEAQTPDPQVNYFKSKALQQLGRLEESVNCMSLAVSSNNGSLSNDVMLLLYETIDNIDSLQSQSRQPQTMLQHCKTLAEFAHKSLKNNNSVLALAEICILEADKDKEKLSQAEKLINNVTDNIDVLRCRSRLLMAQAHFDKAAGLWARICDIRKNEMPAENQRSSKWWRAKYYELYCLAKSNSSQKEKIAHTIKVLENSFINIPSFWAEKLALLKKQCAAGPEQ